MHPHQPNPRRRRIRAALTVPLIGMALAASPNGTAASANTTEPGEARLTSSAAGMPMARPAPGLPGLPDVSAALGGVAVDGPEFRAAASAYAGADNAHAGHRDARTGIDRRLPALAAEQRRLETTLAAAEGRAEATLHRIEVLDGAIRDLLVDLYVTGGNAQAIDAAALADDPSVNDEERRRVLAGSSLETLLAEREAFVAQREAALAEATAISGELAAIAEQRISAAQARPAAETAEVAAGDGLAARRVDYEAARVLAGVLNADFPLVALDAYHRAAARMESESPSCGVQWWAIAGISKVEGRHGTFGGSSLDRYGNTTRRIIGIPLDGNNETAAISDTDGGALDGDPVHDRAVGPMQFIPSTWRSFAADGNGDGAADPHNLYDAALAAARYLCRASGGLSGDGGLRSAYLAYNRSNAYVEYVLGYARGYERAVAIPPVGT
jgi:membrane-bound lytic murein transglycosylase B